MIFGPVPRWLLRHAGLGSLLSIVLSIDPDIIRHPEGRTTACHAVRQRFRDFLPDFVLPFGRLISVRSVVQLYPGPYTSPQALTANGELFAEQIADHVGGGIARTPGEESGDRLEVVAAGE